MSGHEVNENLIQWKCHKCKQKCSKISITFLFLLFWGEMWPGHILRWVFMSLEIYKQAKAIFILGPPTYTYKMSPAPLFTRVPRHMRCTLFTSRRRHMLYNSLYKNIWRFQQRGWLAIVFVQPYLFITKIYSWTMSDRYSTSKRQLYFFLNCCSFLSWM